MDWLVVAACIVGVLAAARLTRLVVQDVFPPAAWLRAKWDARTENSSWNALLHCTFCFAPWMSALVLASALLSDLHPAWWIFHGWLAGSYLASMVVMRDEPIDD